MSFGSFHGGSFFKILTALWLSWRNFPWSLPWPGGSNHFEIAGTFGPTQPENHKRWLAGPSRSGSPNPGLKLVKEAEKSRLHATKPDQRIGNKSSPRRRYKPNRPWNHCPLFAPRPLLVERADLDLSLVHIRAAMALITSTRPTLSWNQSPYFFPLFA